MTGSGPYVDCVTDRPGCRTAPEPQSFTRPSVVFGGAESYA